MLLGYHTLWALTASIVGSDEQADRFSKLQIEKNAYIGGAVNPRDNDLKITDNGDTISFSGFKHFTTGAAISDLIVLEGSVESGEHIFAIVPTDQAGIQFSYNWNNIGLRLTESGSATITDVSAPWADALGWDVKTKKPDPAVLGVPWGSLLLPLIQLQFSNFYLGIALGALDTAKKYTTTTTRPWPYGGDVSCHETSLTPEQGESDRRVLHSGAVRQFLRPPQCGRCAVRQDRGRGLRPACKVRWQPCGVDRARAWRVGRAGRQRQGRQHRRRPACHGRPLRGHRCACHVLQGRL